MKSPLQNESIWSKKDAIAAAAIRDFHHQFYSEKNKTKQDKLCFTYSTLYVLIKPKTSPLYNLLAQKMVVLVMENYRNLNDLKRHLGSSKKES